MEIILQINIIYVCRKSETQTLNSQSAPDGLKIVELPSYLDLNINVIQWREQNE